jgi:iron(III) transport system substrate-binding protein
VNIESEKEETIMRAMLSAILFLGILTSRAEAGSAGQEEWERVLLAAKKEGQVAVLASTGTYIRDALTLPFTKQYGIPVELTGTTGAQQAARVLTERRAGQYLWDVFVSGTTTGLSSFVPAGAFDPIEPALLLPDVKDPQKWRGGAQEYADSGRRIFVMTPTQRTTIAVNSQLLDPKTIKSHRDLLQPKWKGSFMIDDPRLAGSSQATFTFFYRHPDLGPDYIRALATQEALVVRDPTQSLSMLGQGKYSLLVGPRETVLQDAIRRGLPIAVIDPRMLREGSDISSGAGNVALYNRAPHPNAAKVYINWLLSKEGQYGFAKALGYISKRLDVPNDYAESWRVPQPGAIKTYDQEAIALKDKIMVVLQEAFGR